MIVPIGVIVFGVIWLIVSIYVFIYMPTDFSDWPEIREMQENKNDTEMLYLLAPISLIAIGTGMLFHGGGI